MVSAISSALSEKAARWDTAMTGEVTLTGRVLPIGGLKEKTCAAYTQGIKRVIIPVGNLPDLEKIDPEVREGLEFIPCSHVSEVLENVLVSKKQDKNTGSLRPRKTARNSSQGSVRISTAEA